MEPSERDPAAVSNLSEGDTDPGLKKRIRFLIARRPDYIVYLDDNCGVQWRLPGKSVEATSPLAHRILNEVGFLETLSIPLEGTEHLQPVRRLLGESVARLFSGGSASEEMALKLLADARLYLQDRMAEMARIWYLSAAGLFAFLSLVGMLCVWLNREWLAGIFNTSIVEVVLGSGLGALGAFMSLLTRSTEIRVAAGAGRKIHYVEALSRVAAGAVGAVLVALAVKANILFGAVNPATGADLTFLLLLCLVAGTSERLVPGIIAKVESSATSAQDRRSSESTQKPNA